MKRKIALFGTGWGAELLYRYTKGAFERLKQNGDDLYCHICYALYGEEEKTRNGELNIFELAKNGDYDGALIVGNGLDFEGVHEGIADWFAKRGLPVVSCGKRVDNSYFVGSDNYSGTLDMANHLMDEHGVKDIFFIAGSRENMDSNMRMKAIRDALEAHGCGLPEERVWYSNWNPNAVGIMVNGMLDSGAKMPEAFCCANDELAMMTCQALKKRGLSVPEDVLVTGFDNEYLGKIFTPAISSIDQNFEKIGYESADLVLQLIEGRKGDTERTVKCTFMPSESCGCGHLANYDELRRELGSSQYVKNLAEASFDRKIISLERSIMSADEFEDLHGCLEQFYIDDHRYEKDTFFIFIDPSYKKTITNQDMKIRRKGYASDMMMVYGMCDGEVYPPVNGKFTAVLSEASKQESRFYLLAPLHEGDEVFGFIVFCDDVDKIIESNSLFRYVERLSLSLGKFHMSANLAISNQRLMEMTETDALTRVKNRTAYELAVAKYDHKIKNSTIDELGLAVFDINNLKKINDRLGHEAGDEYIINCCRLVCRNYKKSRVYRIGGDEFAVILEGEDFYNRDKIYGNLVKEMKQLMSAPGLGDTERVSVAAGITAFDSVNDSSVADIFNRADGLMYANKAAMKAER